MNLTVIRTVCCGSVLLLVAAAWPAHARRLNDTGQVNCYTFNAQAGTVSPATPNGTLPDPRYERQDCTRGLSAADAMGRMTKIGASSTKGRDYTKLSNAGAVLPADAALGNGAADWACTRDNITGLVWEVKTSDGGVRDVGKNYNWANALAFPATVNGTALCGYANWRLPTVHELVSLIDANVNNPAIDRVYFPNTRNDLYWSGVSHPADAAFSLYVRFSDGFIGSTALSGAIAVRLVRSDP